MDCIFCKIANKEVDSEFLYESDSVVAFDDIKHDLPVHILIVPKRHLASISDIQLSDKELIGEMVLVAKELAEKNKLTGYKLAINVGRDGGQIIDHLHLHLLGGAKF